MPTEQAAPTLPAESDVRSVGSAAFSDAYQSTSPVESTVTMPPMTNVALATDDSAQPDL